MKALYELTITLIFVSNLLEELKRAVELPVMIYEDSQPTIDLINQSTCSGSNRSKHFIMLTRFVKGQVEKRLIEIRKIAGEKNKANVLTKIITGREFNDSFNKIMGTAHSQ